MAPYGNTWINIDSGKMAPDGTKPLLEAMFTSLTHLSRVPHAYASVNWLSLGSGNGLSPVRRQAITWTNADLLSIRPLERNLSEIRTNIKIFH